MAAREASETRRRKRYIHNCQHSTFKVVKLPCAACKIVQQLLFHPWIFLAVVGYILRTRIRFGTTQQFAQSAFAEMHSRPRCCSISASGLRGQRAWLSLGGGRRERAPRRLLFCRPPPPGFEAGAQLGSFLPPLPVHLPHTPPPLVSPPAGNSLSARPPSNGGHRIRPRRRYALRTQCSRRLLRGLGALC
jgi:hypothetical protein